MTSSETLSMCFLSEDLCYDQFCDYPGVLFQRTCDMTNSLNLHNHVFPFTELAV